MYVDMLFILCKCFSSLSRGKTDEKGRTGGRGDEPRKSFDRKTVLKRLRRRCGRSKDSLTVGALMGIALTENNQEEASTSSQH